MNTKQNNAKAGRGWSALSGSVKITFLSLLAFTAIVIAATCLRADSGTQPALAGTWVGHAGSALSPALVSYTGDGRVIFSRPTAVIGEPNPNANELASTGHGEWIRTGDGAFTATVLTMRSGTKVDFTGFVKQVQTMILDRTTDQLAITGTAYIYDADGNLLAAVPQPGVGLFKRIVAGQ